MNYRVVIPTAGLGSRLKHLSANINKALVSIANKPAISYIVEKFPEDIELVIPLGYKKETVRDFLTIAYPKRKFIFKEVYPFEGEGSGLGLTLLACKEELQSPFIFCSNDTIVLEDIPAPTFNWMGYTDAPNNDQYRSIRITKEAEVVEICSKGAKGDVKPYIGLAGISDYKQFWKSMEDGKGKGSIETGESYGMRSLLNLSVKSIPFTWYDTGNIDALEKCRTAFSSLSDDNNPNILEKENEAIWFVGDKVVKYHTDETFIKNRVLRSAFLGNYIPEIISSSSHMYVYKKVEGEIFSKHPTATNFKMFLKWMDGFWSRKMLNGSEERHFTKRCDTFYRKKTYERVEQYFKKSELSDEPEIVNDLSLPTLKELLNEVDWEYLSHGIPVRFHGDLHFENILVCSSGKEPFSLLDWRQDFGGELDYGDIYYDFAKLLHGLIISHELICQESYWIDRVKHKISFDFHRKHSLIECEKYFNAYVSENGFDWDKVELLTALIFLNIAPLHHYPYTHLLFYLGKSMLYKKMYHEN
jgi:dTDP-glucose pyrophosphorylase